MRWAEIAFNGFNWIKSHRIARLGASAVAFSIALAALTGCESKGWLDPTQVGRWRQEALLLPILPDLMNYSGVDEPEPSFLNATDVRQMDLQVEGSDYRIGKGDLISVSITDLAGPGIETVKTARVSETGQISLPLVETVPAEGRTEAELEKAIVGKYKDANIIQNAQVSATVSEARARTFSIIGSVQSPGQYAILQSDFRMLDALVVSRDVTVPNVEWVYVIRRLDSEPKSAATGGKTTQPGAPADDLAPRSEAPSRGMRVARTPGRLVLLQAGGDPDVAPASGNGTGQTPPTTAPAPEGRFITVEGQTIAVGGDEAAPDETDMTAAAATTAPATQGFEFNEPKTPTDTRIIRIPLTALKNGDLRYNIVVRPKDLIVVPPPIIGEYYMAGNVGSPGVYSLSNRRITLKQAIVSARMLGPLAIPQRTEIIRRIGTDKEVFVRVDLEKIWDGKQPDLFLKPDDIVNVGTNMFAPFIAAVRGAFRFTYGFGFLYDRNFAYDRNGNLL